MTSLRQQSLCESRGLSYEESHAQTDGEHRGPAWPPQSWALASTTLMTQRSDGELRLSGRPYP
jgi:hypothetical protein